MKVGVLAKLVLELTKITKYRKLAAGLQVFSDIPQYPARDSIDFLIEYGQGGSYQ